LVISRLDILLDIGIGHYFDLVLLVVLVVFQTIKSNKNLFGGVSTEGGVVSDGR
jgi:hypothetical protein